MWVKETFFLLYFYLAAFKLVKTWLGPDAVGFLKTVSKNDIQEYISAEYLPPYMGGTVSVLLRRNFLVQLLTMFFADNVWKEQWYIWGGQVS